MFIDRNCMFGTNLAPKRWTDSTRHLANPNFQYRKLVFSSKVFPVLFRVSRAHSNSRPTCINAFSSVGVRGPRYRCIYSSSILFSESKRKDKTNTVVFTGGGKTSLKKWQPNWTAVILNHGNRMNSRNLKLRKYKWTSWFRRPCPGFGVFGKNT